MNTHLSFIQLWILFVFCEEEHVYEVDKYAGSTFRLGRSVDDPFEDHHKHQIAKETQHEDQLRDQHEKYAAYLAKVPRNKREKQHEIKVRINTTLFNFVQTAWLLSYILRVASRYNYYVWWLLLTCS